MHPVIEIKIEHGVPLFKAGNQSIISEALKQMKPGDSFLYPEATRASVGCAAKRLGIRVTTRKLGDGNIRVWRLK